MFDKSIPDFIKQAEIQKKEGLTLNKTGNK
jgi:hypothetical protein